MLHQPCDLRLLDRFNLCNHNQFDQRPNRKRQRQVRQCNNRHLARDRYRRRQVHRGRYRHRQLRDDQKVV